MPSATLAVPAAHQSPLLSIHGLSLDQGTFSLELSGFDVLPGARIGVLGRNGCGKTTLLEAIVGLRVGTSIEGQMFGVRLPKAVRRPALRRRIGCQLQSAGFSRYATVRELLDLHLALYGSGDPLLAALLQLDELLLLRAGLLSRGQRQRLELYMAMAHGPALVLLDEPMTGLDRRFIRALVRFVQEELPRQTALLVAGHTDDELQLVDEVAWLECGKLVDRGSPEELVARHAGPEILRIRFHCMDALLAAETGLSSLPGVRCWTQPDEVLLNICGGAEMVKRAKSLCTAQDIRVWEQAHTSVADLVRLGVTPRHATIKGVAVCPA